MNFALRSFACHIYASKLFSVANRITSTSAFWLPCRRIRPSRCSMSRGRQGTSRSCLAMARAWMLVPAPSRSVDRDHGDLAPAAGGEQHRLVWVVVGLVNEPDTFA